MDDDIIGQKFGLSHDRYMAKYHLWTWDRFPLRLPACEIHLEQSPHERADQARVTWAIQEGVPIVCRLDDADGRVLVELLPRLPTKHAAEPSFAHHDELFDAERLSATPGFAFEWVFSIPVNQAGEYQPTHPLGIVLFERERILARATCLRIIAKLRE